MRHEEPRLEATLAGFDIRSPMVGPSAGVTPANMAPKIRAVCPLYDTRRVKITQRARLSSGTSGALARCPRAIRRVSTLRLRRGMFGNGERRPRPENSGHLVANGAGVASPGRPGGAPKRRGRIRSGRRVSAFVVGLVGEPVPGPSHFLHDFAMPLGLGFSSEAPTFLRKSPVFRCCFHAGITGGSSAPFRMHGGHAGGPRVSPRGGQAAFRSAIHG